MSGTRAASAALAPVRAGMLRLASDQAAGIIADARRENRPMNSRDAMLSATDEMTTDFETAMRRKYGDIVVDMLGIPDATDRRLAD